MNPPPIPGCICGAAATTMDGVSNGSGGASDTGCADATLDNKTATAPKVIERHIATPCNFIDRLE